MLGNRRPLQALCSNGRWTGVPLRKVLDRAGVKPEAREFVFFGADRGEEEVEWRTQKFKVEQQFGRSLPREKALAPELETKKSFLEDNSQFPRKVMIS